TEPDRTWEWLELQVLRITCQDDGIYTPPPLSPLPSSPRSVSATDDLRSGRSLVTISQIHWSRHAVAHRERARCRQGGPGASRSAPRPSLLAASLVCLRHRSTASRVRLSTSKAAKSIPCR